MADRMGLVRIAVQARTAKINCMERAAFHDF